MLALWQAGRPAPLLQQL